MANTTQGKIENRIEVIERYIFPADYKEKDKDASIESEVLFTCGVLNMPKERLYRRLQHILQKEKCS